MLRERVLVAIVLIPIGGWIIFDGGWIFGVAFSLVLALAAWEYGAIYRGAGFRPALPILFAGALVLGLLRYAFGFQFAPLALVSASLLSMTWHSIDFERGAARSGTDLALTLGGFLYIGWVGAYMISLRGLPDGLAWFLIVLPSLWIADSSAYFFGRAFGRHRMAPRLSPKKSWEGYLAGIVLGALGGALLALIIQRFLPTPFDGTVQQAFVIAGLVAVLAPIGDLGISMIKRELEVKDTGRLLPGHGGVLDRIDSWIWAGALGFYLIPLVAGWM